MFIWGFLLCIKFNVSFFQVDNDTVIFKNKSWVDRFIIDLYLIRGK